MLLAEFFSLGAFNPAVAVGLGLIKSACWGGVGVIALTNLVAGFVAALVYKVVDAE